MTPSRGRDDDAIPEDQDARTPPGRPRRGEDRPHFRYGFSDYSPPREEESEWTGAPDDGDDEVDAGAAAGDDDVVGDDSGKALKKRFAAFNGHFETLATATALWPCRDDALRAELQGAIRSRVADPWARFYAEHAHTQFSAKHADAYLATERTPVGPSRGSHQLFNAASSILRGGRTSCSTPQKSSKTVSSSSVGAPQVHALDAVARRRRHRQAVPGREPAAAPAHVDALGRRGRRARRRGGRAPPQLLRFPPQYLRLRAMMGCGRLCVTKTCVKLRFVPRVRTGSRVASRVAPWPRFL